MYNSVIKSDDIEWVLDEFFKDDKKLTSNSLIRSSVLLAARRDMKFLRGVFLSDFKLKLNTKQKDEIRSQLPSFAAILVFCSVVDLLARITKGEQQKKYQNGKLFIRSSKRWFNLSITASKALWQFRNSVSHQYTILPNTRTYPYGFNGIMQYNKKLKSWEYNLNGMYSSLRSASNKAYDYINNLSPKNRLSKANYIYRYGFIYTRAI